MPLGVPPPTTTNSPATVEVSAGDGSEMTLSFSGRLDATTVGSIWSDAVTPVRQSTPSRLVVELGGVTHCDGPGLGMFMELDAVVREAGGTASFSGMSTELGRMLDMALLRDPKARQEPPRTGSLEQVGRSAAAVWGDLVDIVAWVGELSLALVWAVRKPHRVRWQDTSAVAEKAGVDATPVVCLLGFLVGLIIAFQAAGPMREMGAESLVPTVVGFAIIRELGPLITAIILAGRSGSAFAAEIGTMRVTEEIDALTTLGLDPARFLVVPRVIAALVMTPLLSVFATFMGMVGGYLVMASMGYSLAYYIDQVTATVGYVDMLQGVFKMIVFALLIAAIGCLRGLKTKSGPGAVGDSTTSAVVAGIVLVVIADGAMGVVFYYIGI